ncbi:LexA family protein [Microbulbifer echini]|uniref:LexA family protein n=1 Tax=Microbulbifer echini TaxID=1529067 RepID=A0ABV4NQT5_9GAMM
MKLSPLYGHGIACGFPSPADDHKEAALSLDEHLISKPAATFMARANGDSMMGLGIFDKDLLIVDRSRKVEEVAGFNIVARRCYFLIATIFFKIIRGVSEADLLCQLPWALARFRFGTPKVASRSYTSVFILVGAYSCGRARGP